MTENREQNRRVCNTPSVAHAVRDRWNQHGLKPILRTARPSSLVVRSAALAILAAVAIVTGLSGCKGEKPDGSGTKELLLYCGAGIRPPVQQIIEAFEAEYGVKIVTDYAGSEMLLSKIKLARQGDLYMPGDKHYVEQAAQEGMILSQQSVCYFVPTILVQKANPKNIHGLHDLLKAGIKLGVGDAKACAIGRKTEQIFARNGIARADVEKNIAFQSLTVNELGMQIQAGSLDAVIVWDAIARYYSDHGIEVPIPVEQNVISTVNIGVLAFTGNRPLAEEFVKFAGSPRGQDIFQKHNYRTDSPQ
ncbi:MAG: molybdate ABC transporter substrate-binding protein [Planctomycetota bacterium]